MSNTKHTPGPWLESNSPVTKAKPSGRWFKSVKNTRSIGGKIIGNGYGDTKEEAEANAKLIAAAPELLEAAEKLLEVIGHVGGVEPQRKALIAAIKKATE